MTLSIARLMAALAALALQANTIVAFSTSIRSQTRMIPLSSREKHQSARSLVVLALPIEKREDSTCFSRRTVLESWLASSSASILLWNHRASPAHAAYGDGSKIELPSYIDFLIEKNTQVDPSTFLYQGADREAQLERISAAESRIKSIPAIAQSRKWSQVQGILTGPLGTLIQTMNQISGSNKDALKAAANVKADLLMIGQAAAKKSEDACIAASEAALQNLETFSKVVF